MLECSGVCVSYGLHRALDDVSMRVGLDEIVVILGANGAGKTTLLNAIAGRVPLAEGGRIALDGVALTNRPPHEVVEAGLALVPEGRGIFGELTVRENLLLGAHARRARAQQEDNLQRVLELFPRLGERAGQVARTMSGGEQQMVAIGRALMSAPRLLMLDEPSLGLSPLLCIELFRALVRIRSAGVGILLVEQNAKQGLAIADRAYLLENGRVVGEGPADALAQDPAVQRAYLGAGAPREVVPETPASAPPPPASSPAAPAARPVVTVDATVDAVPDATRRFPVAGDAHDEARRQAGETAVRAVLGGGARTPASTRAEALIPQSIAELVSRAAAVQADDVRQARARARIGAVPSGRPSRAPPEARSGERPPERSDAAAGSLALVGRSALDGFDTFEEAIARVSATAARALDRSPGASEERALRAGR